MSGRDAWLALGWCGVLAAALAAGVCAHRRGLDRHLVRDALHVGAGVWVLGWPLWDGMAAPAAIVCVAAGLAATLPALGRRFAALTAVPASLSAHDERWTGIVWYTAAFAAFTLVAFAGRPYPAGAALLALCLGDGLGGLVGRRWGRRGFRVPGGKRKTLAGSATVVGMGALGVLTAAHWFGADPALVPVLGGGLVAGVAEAVAPRATDNALLPVAVFAFVQAVA